MRYTCEWEAPGNPTSTMSDRDLKAYYKSHATAGGCRFMLTGGVNLSGLRPDVESLLADIEARGKETPDQVKAYGRILRAWHTWRGACDRVRWAQRRSAMVEGPYTVRKHVAFGDEQGPSAYSVRRLSDSEDQAETEDSVGLFGTEDEAIALALTCNDFRLALPECKSIGLTFDAPLPSRAPATVVSTHEAARTIVASGKRTILVSASYLAQLLARHDAHDRPRRMTGPVDWKSAGRKAWETRQRNLAMRQEAAA